MKVVGQVTEEEKNEILELFERKTGLENLVNIIDPTNAVLYDKLVKDYGEITIQFNDWWNTKKKDYNWPDSIMRIDFKTNEIIEI
ncbi:CXXX repeat peptide modification system protein [Dielma fastidiosa]|uniref:CXXX repeat modification system protein n=1 Tax=Dielma fastidiosa TaxID=1034346 RepID=A0A318KH47_9FIRM|nr:CXXX repeat peptide modification system protein [Dielma fastidiosa]PXX74498.1 CXXX repeat modification system protein [Dielma fastidiosa]